MELELFMTDELVELLDKLPETEDNVIKLELFALIKQIARTNDLLDSLGSVIYQWYNHS